jgi:agmatinase
MFGPDVTFLGVPPCDLDDPSTFEGSKAIIVGAPFDSGTSYRSGTRFGPSALRIADYSHQRGSRPHLALRVDPLVDLAVTDAGDVLMAPTETEHSLRSLTSAVAGIARRGIIPVVLGGDHTVAMADVTGIAEHYGLGRIAVIHFDAHADTGDLEYGSRYGHGQPMRRLIESGVVRGEKFLQIGLRGYWPGHDVLNWMAEQKMRSFEMTEIGARGLNAVLDEAFEIATDDTDGVYLSVDIDVVDPGLAPGTGTPEPGGLTSRELLDAVRRVGRETPLVGLEMVEVCPAYDQSDITALLGSRVVLETLSGIARRQLDDADRAAGRPLWDPSSPLLTNR